MRKRWVLLIALALGVGILAELSLLGVSFKPIVDEYWQENTDSPLRINRTVPYFQVETVSGRTLTPASPAAKFYLYVLDERFTQACLNLECGSSAAKVVALGGNLFGIADPEIVTLFGIKTIHNPSPSMLFRSLAFADAWKRLRGEPLVRFDSRLVVVADQYGRIRKVFRHAMLRDISEVLQKAGYGP